MEPQDPIKMYGLRCVVCMFCTWTWYTGRPDGEEAKCPRCGYIAGVDKFMVMKPEVAGYVIVMPHQQMSL